MRKTREPFIEKYKEKEAARYITWEMEKRKRSLLPHSTRFK
jgi:hypothetical protein